MTIKRVDVRPRRASRRPVTLTDLVDREHRRVAKLSCELLRLRRQLARARLRYSTYKRMLNDQLRRGAGLDVETEP